MGESVCLVRSFSQPAEISSRETNEALPRRVLTESVSFGRFASESLQWEKWSAFTQNRYLEEVERFTKPGSVAQKKAFFEAHFKNRAAGRTTKTKMDEVNVKTSDESVCESLIGSEVPLVVNNGMAIKEVRHEEVSVVPLISVMDETTGEDEALDVEDLNLNSMAVPEDEALDVVDLNLNSVAVSEDEALDEENFTSLSKEKRSSSSVTKTCSSKLEPSSVKGLDTSLKKIRKEPPSSVKRSIRVSKNQNRSPLEPFHMSFNGALSGNTDKNFVGIPQNGSRSSTNANGAGKAVKKMKSGPSSVHMSLNLASSARQTSKTATQILPRKASTLETTSSNARSSAFPNENGATGASKSRKRPVPPTVKEGFKAAKCASKNLKRPVPPTVKEGFKAAKCSTTASPVKVPKFPSPNNLLSEDKRKNITAGSSVSCRISDNVKRLPSVGSRAKSFTVSSPFNFRSDERAEKRKEFFKKLEEKNKKEDTVKEHFSCGFKANQNTHLASKEHKNPQVGGFQVPLLSLTSPRFRMNQIPETENIKKSHQTPHKVSSVKTTNTRHASMEKHRRCKIHPSQTKKKTQENLSPNILQN